MAVLKVIEVLANSDKSWEDAAKKANEIDDYRVNVKITFEVK